VKIGIPDFELYLMSHMSASQLVQRALERRGLTDAQMKATASAVVQHCQLRDGSPHSSYHQVLQSVLLFEASTPDDDDDPTDSFASSTSYFYRLPEWPNTPLQINRSRRGNAWGINFVQDPAALIPAPTQRQIQPWKFALDGVRSLLTWQEEDAWSDYQRDMFQQGQTTAIMRGTFDFGLLQDWREETMQPLRKWQSPAPPTLTRLGWPRRP
jgi:hypothetical protein